MVDNLRRRGLSSEAISDLCLMCGEERETMDHLFVHRKLSSRSGVLWSAPSSWLGGGLEFGSFHWVRCYALAVSSFCFLVVSLDFRMKGLRRSLGGSHLLGRGFFLECL